MKARTLAHVGTHAVAQSSRRCEQLFSIPVTRRQPVSVLRHRHIIKQNADEFVDTIRQVGGTAQVFYCKLFLECVKGLL